MNPTRKQQIIEILANAASSSVGTMAGVMAGAALTANATDHQEYTIDDDGIEIVRVDPPEDETPDHQPGRTEPPVKQGNSVLPDDVEVIRYERHTDENGNEYDMAVLRVDGTELAVIDADLDGVADAMLIDYNGDGIIDRDEIIDIHNHNVMMQPLADANQDLLFAPDQSLPAEEYIAVSDNSEYRLEDDPLVTNPDTIEPEPINFGNDYMIESDDMFMA